MEPNTVSKEEVIGENRCFLKSRREYLQGWLDRNNGSMSGLRAGHAMDRLDRIGEELIIVATREEIERKKKQLANVEKFLKLIETKDYGVCKGCKEQIPPERLAALPMTEYCVSCSERCASPVE